MTNTRINCPTCERMGRVTVIMPQGTLTTTTCGTCNGEGYIMDHHSEGCVTCTLASAKMLKATPLFA